MFVFAFDIVFVHEHEQRTRTAKITTNTNTNNEHHELFADHYCLPTSLPHHQGCYRGGVGGPPRYMFSIYLCHSGLGNFSIYVPPDLGCLCIISIYVEKNHPRPPPGIWNSIYVLVFSRENFFDVRASLTFCNRNIAKNATFLEALVGFILLAGPDSISSESGV